MNLKQLAIAATAGAALLGASSAFANPPHWAPAYGWHAKHRHHYQPRPVVIYAPAPVYYEPAPVYYAPPPQVVLPGPFIYGRVPVNRGVRVSFGMRL